MLRTSDNANNLCAKWDLATQNYSYILAVCISIENEPTELHFLSADLRGL